MARSFPRGARPSPRHKILAAHPHLVLKAPPAQFAIVPKQLDVWGNDQYGDCVSAEEAFAKACYSPEVFISGSTVINWAERHGWLNGADLTSVMDAMQSDGFMVGSQRYNDGHYTGVDYSNQAVLQSAISQGPVKIAIDASALPSGAGNHQGWFDTGGGNYSNTDHCVALSGYGPADWLYQQLGVSLPSGLPAATAGYLLFTWSTIGFVDHSWLMGTCTEAWVRNPTTVGVPPLTPPVPPTPPTPPVPSFEGLTLLSMLGKGTYSVGGWSLVGLNDLAAGAYPLVRPTPPPPPPPPPTPTDPKAKAIADLQEALSLVQSL